MINLLFGILFIAFLIVVTLLLGEIIAWITGKEDPYELYLKTRSRRPPRRAPGYKNIYKKENKKEGEL